LFTAETTSQIGRWCISGRSGEVGMTNSIQDVQAILREIVNDLEKTSAGLIYISKEFHKHIPTKISDQLAGCEAAVQANKGFYDKLRTQIDALEITS
jgi:hypothetical protein